MNVALFPIDDEGCGRYRIRFPARAAAETGDVMFRFGALRRQGPKIVGMPAGADVAVFQRPLHILVPQLIPQLQRAGVAVVIDIDDDFATIDARHPMFPTCHPVANKASNWHNLKQACRLADLITVTTPALAERYGRSKTVVLPNCVSASLLDVRADRDGRTVGWGGFTFTHVGDLTVTRGGVAAALADTGARFLSVGSPDGVREQLGLPDEPDSTGPQEFDAYHQALAQLDVGIVPLADTAFNAAKSALKGLEYAALGIPFVASPRADYQRIRREGIGVLADDRARHWRRQVARFLSDDALRAETGARLRELIRDGHTYERNGWRWAEAWQQAIDRRSRSRSRAA